MKQLTERDKMLAMLLPTLIILMVYGLFFLRGKVLELRRTQDALAKAKMPSAAEIAFKAAEANKLNKETQAIEAQLAAVQKKWSYETAFCAAGSQRHDRVEKLTHLLNKHHLTSMEDAEADSGGKDVKVSVPLESLIQKIAHLSSAQKPQLRRIRFYGRFVDVHDVLEELAKGSVLAVPVGLSMKTTVHPDLREWTLLVWL
jgi:hypothetical protein